MPAEESNNEAALQTPDRAATPLNVPASPQHSSAARCILARASLTALPRPGCSPCHSAARLNYPATAFFITRVDSEEEAALKPLLHEGPVKGCAVEHASAHVAGAQPAKVLRYEPLKGSDDGAH